MVGVGKAGGQAVCWMVAATERAYKQDGGDVFYTCIMHTACVSAQLRPCRTCLLEQHQCRTCLQSLPTHLVSLQQQAVKHACSHLAGQHSGEQAGQPGAHQGGGGGAQLGQVGLDLGELLGHKGLDHHTLNLQAITGLQNQAHAKAGVSRLLMFGDIADTYGSKQTAGVC